MGKLKKIGIGFGILILLFFVFGILASIGSESIEEDLKNPELTFTEIRDQAIPGISYDELMRNNEKYVDKILYLEGKVIQIQDVYGDTYALRVSITKEVLSFGSSFWTDPIFVNYAGQRILEDDIVQMFVKVKGIKQYTAVLGNSISIPEVDSLILVVSEKRD